MSRLLILYNYNKYYNRIIKRLSSFQEYLNLITPPGEGIAPAFRGFIRENTNFDISDGVYAKHVINISNEDPEYMKVEHPDYLILEESYTQDEVTTTKLSRWFILEVTRVRGNQWEFGLRRDLLADYYNEVLNAPIFVEKGYLQSLDDPLLFNKESMTYNQIKKGEILLTQTKLSGKGKGWVIGYIASETADNPTAISDCIADIENPAIVQTWEGLSSALKSIINAGQFDEYNGLQFEMNFYSKSGSQSYYNYLIYSSSGVGADYNKVGFDLTGSMLTLLRDNRTEIINTIKDSYTDNILYSVNSVFNSERPDVYSSASDYYNALNGLIYQRDGKYYKVQVTKNNTVNKWYKRYTAAQVLSGSDTLSIQARIALNYLASTDIFNSRTPDQNSEALYFTKNVQHYTVSVVEVAYNQIKCDIPANRNKNSDAPYDLFAIPLGGIDIYNNSELQFTTKENLALPMARAIATKGTSDRIYDIQVLPYCPFDEIIDENGNIELSGFTEHKDYEFITNTVSETVTNVGIIIFPKTCKGTFDINLTDEENLYDYLVEERESIVSKKIKAETEFVRFVSPNFASQFEINVQKNKGITNLNVDYFYKPYSPYIHVAPYFKGLYGLDYNDPKGLICSGDFSISTSSSQWEKYQIENKNYELIFNRQIQNLDVNNSIAYQQAAITGGIGVATSVLTGIGAGAASGAMLGSFAPGIGTLVGAGAGALIGGIGGGITSAVGKKYDLEYLKKSQSEARSYAKDMYAYSLGNIQALPYTLTKVTTITPNNKVFPFLEVYDCTEEEKQALEDKLFYNGFTVMRIGKISDYLGNGNYVQGQLIRLVGIDEDSQVVAEIAQEIKEGAYYYGSDSSES